MHGAARTGRRWLRTLERRRAGNSGSRRLILAYHDVRTTSTDPWQLCVPPDVFERQIEMLTEVGSVLPLQALIAANDRSRGTAQRFAVTFDDGYVSNLSVALPILERYDASATIFVPSGLVGMPHFWWDRLAWTVLEATEPGELYNWWSGCVRGEFDHRTGHVPTRENLLAEMHRVLVELSPNRIEEMLDDITDSLHLPLFEPVGRPVTDEELRTLASHPLIEIGAHTVNHRRLTSLSRSDCCREMRQSRVDLDDRLGVADRVLAYPYGRCDPYTAAAAREAGFRSAVTTVPAALSRFDQRRLLPRAIVPPGCEITRFPEWLQSID